MNDTFLFLWGLLAFLLAVGPLIVAAMLDFRTKDKNTGG